MLLLSAATCTGSAQDDGTTTILDLIGENGNFTIISGFFNNSSLNTTLAGEEPYTVFVPTDAAFANVSEDTLEALKEDPAALEQVLLYHVANGTLMAEDLANVSNVTTLQGSELPVNVTEEGVFIGEAEVLQANLTADNGVIHVIDAVLIPPEAPPEEKDIIETATADGNFTTLLAAIGAANLTDTLKGEGPYTVFAPTDDAFDALPEGTIEALLNDTEKLTNILLYHVAAEKLMAGDVVNMTNITTVQGSSLPVNVTEEGVFVGNAKITVQDVNASNGVIHVIDAVLIPPEAPPEEKDIIETATADGNFTTLLAAVEAANLTDTLKGEGPYTVFAPTNEAFNALPEGTVEALLNDTEKLTNILLYHVAAEKLMAEDVVNMTNITTVQGSSLPVNVTEEGVFVGNAKIIVQDVNASNGVIHAIDAVLIPPEEEKQNLTVLYNDTVNLTEGNVIFRPDAEKNYTIGNLTDFGALYATGLNFNAVLAQNITENVTDMTNVSFVLKSIEGVENDNTTGEMWFIYINGEPAEENLGMNPVSDGDKLSFWYTTEDGGAAAIENATYVVNITVNEMMAKETIIEAAQNQTKLTTFVNATEAANLTETLSGTGPYTVFIPSNEAFDELPEETRNELMNNTTLLRDVLSYHVSSGKYTREQLASMNTVDNIQGNALQINMVGDNITIQNATITQIIIVNNGVICIIDKVLIPPDSGLPSDGDQTDGNQTDGNQTEDLAGDWYFFSIPFEANNTSVDYLLSDVNYSSLIYYNASTKLFEDVSNIEPLKGYWINVPNGTEFNAEEQFASVEKKLVTVPPSLQTYPGWNALGSPVNETVTAQTAFASLNNSYVKVVGPWVPGNNTTGYYQYVGYNSLNGTLGENQLGADEFEVEPYQGYWVFVKEEGLYA